MIKFENTEVYGWEAAIRGMRNPMNSWEKSDSEFSVCECEQWPHDIKRSLVLIGPNDYDLMMRLRNAGADHRKFMRMITVTVDITAPIYLFKELDTYKVGTVRNSTSTMHKIHAKEFTLEDFSHEHLTEEFLMSLKLTIKDLNKAREAYNWCNTDAKKDWWWQMIQLLPSSYNQKSTVLLNYEVLCNMYHSRKNHRLDEWSVGFVNWVKDLPYSELITGEEKKIELNPEAGITNEEA